MKLPMSVKLYGVLVPLILMGVGVAWVTRASLQYNAQELINARTVKELAVTSLALLLIQDDTSKAMFLHPDSTSLGQRKIEAYDQSVKVFERMIALSASPRVRDLINRLHDIDDQQLKPLDESLLEAMAGGDMEQAKAVYFTQYEPARARYEAVLRQLVDEAEAAAGRAADDMAEANRRTLFTIVASLAGGIALVAATVVMLGRLIGRGTRELEQSNAQLTAIQETSLDSIVVMDQQGRVISFNTAAEEAFGYLRADVVGKELAELIVPPAQREAHRQGLRRYLQTGKGSVIGRRVEMKACRRDGSEFPVELAVTVAQVDRRALFTAVLRDVTDQRKAEAERDELNRRLLLASRQAGMAEVATGVLHNVGNVLNSVNVSVAVIGDKMHTSRVPQLVEATRLFPEQDAELASFISNDQRGRALPRFLKRVAEAITAEHAAVEEELKALHRNVEHVKQIINTQQSYASRTSLKDRINLVQLMEDALSISGASLARHEVEVERDFAPVPPVFADPHKVLQIFVNLLSNAKHAMKQSPNKRVALRMRGAEGKVCVSVTDTGCGIPPDNLQRIFQHGFTTKKDGHGFGLHSSILAAKEMGGSLTAQSEGPGRGATFTLELPLAVAEAA